MTLIYRALLLTSLSFLFVSLSATKPFDAVVLAGMQNDDKPLIDVQSASGKITAIRDDEFTIEIQPSKLPRHGFREQDHTTRRTFLINSNTKVDGKLEVGANADVLYRRQGGNNIAVTIRLTAIS